MSKYQVSFASDVTVFTDSKGKIDKFDNIVAVNEHDAIVSLKREGEARISGMQGALSIIVNMFDSPRLDAYKGQTKANEKIPNEVKSARREMETEYLKPLFMATIKGSLPDAAKHKQWDSFIELHRKGGVWSLANSVALQYFCIVGQLPCVYIDGKPHKDKLLSQPAMLKIIANMREADDTTDKGISHKLTELAALVEGRNEKTVMGNTGAAIHALKAMLATFEGLQLAESDKALREYELKAEQTQATAKTDIATQSKAIVDKAIKETKAKQSKAKPGTIAASAKPIDLPAPF